MTKLTFPVLSFRHIDTQNINPGLKNYYAVVNTRDLPDLTGWRKINVRDPKLKGAVPHAIRTSFREKPDMFIFMNRGIVLSVASASFDNKSSRVTLELKDPDLHGLLDGGHTYNIMLEERVDQSIEQFVKVEMLEGLSHEDITQIVDARNTSNQVRDESLMNLAGDFEKLKKALDGAPYVESIAFKEYELDKDGDPRPIDVREVIAILTAFDRDHFDDKVQPINTYRSKAACLKHFKEHSQSYKKIYPLAREILELYDHIQEKLPELYNQVRGQTGDVSGGKFGKLTGVTFHAKFPKTHNDLLFLDKKTMYGVPDGFTYPILGAFRALLEEKNGRYVWGKNLHPVVLLNGELGLKLADTIGNFALDAKNPSKTGKSPLVWQACYQSVQVAYLTAK